MIGNYEIPLSYWQLKTLYRGLQLACKSIGEGQTHNKLTKQRLHDELEDLKEYIWRQEDKQNEGKK